MLFMKTIFATFGGPEQKYYDAVERICGQAKTFNIFDEIIGFTDKDLMADTEFWEKHKDFFEKYPKGYGYWLWKPYIQHKLLQRLDEGDIVVYADAGCELRPKRISRMREYFDMINNSDKGIVGITLGFDERHWTKMDVFQQLECRQFIEDKYQIIATAFVYKKCANTVAIMEEWYRHSCNYHLITDHESVLPNAQGFIEHRHDQSLFSLLMKKHGFIQIGFEVEINMKVPFWARRNFSKQTLIIGDEQADLAADKNWQKF